MKFDVVTRFDTGIIQDLNELQDFKLKNNGHTIIERIAREDEIVIAYGVVKRQAEAIILVNPHVPVISRAKAMRELMKYAEIGALKADCEQLHCFTLDEKLALTLEEKFGFTRVKRITLVKDL